VSTLLTNIENYTKVNYSRIAVHRKNNFIEVSKNLARYKFKIILFEQQNNYVERSN